jgi:antitoxin VapB
MPLSLKNGELEKLARRRAKRRGETLTEAVLSSLRESERNAARAEKSATARQILKLAEETRRLPVLTTRSEDDILGYDERGIPSR